MVRSRTILLVEDEPDLCEAMAQTLHRQGYGVLACADGAEAEHLILHEMPDLVVVEMLLPGRSGFQVARLALERSDGRTPIIMTSWFASPAHRDYAHAAGAASFLRKPFALTDLADLAKQLCPLTRPGTGSRTPPRGATIRS